MKALPLWQPWATLVACGAKRVETRSWPAPASVRGSRVAIHATKGGLSQRDLFHILEWPVFAIALRSALRLPDDTSAAGISKALPRGVVLGTVLLERCAQITAESAAELERINPEEHAFGDYTPGRWAWVLKDRRALPAPISCKGHQGLFDLPEPIARVLGEAPQEGLFA